MKIRDLIRLNNGFGELRETDGTMYYKFQKEPLNDDPKRCIIKITARRGGEITLVQYFDEETQKETFYIKYSCGFMVFGNDMTNSDKRQFSKMEYVPKSSITEYFKSKQNDISAI